jgi:hypothetical protein
LLVVEVDKVVVTVVELVELVVMEEVVVALGEVM